MTIRNATLADIDPLTDLFDAYRVFYGKPSDKEHGRIFLSERFSNKESEVYVAETSDKVLIGFVQLYPLFSSTRMKRLWLLNDLYVEVAYRGQGISKMLIEKCKMLCEETQAAGLLLETAKSNLIGNNLYPATGFVLDTDHNYYTWPD